MKELTSYNRVTQIIISVIIFCYSTEGGLKVHFQNLLWGRCGRFVGSF